MFNEFRGLRENFDIDEGLGAELDEGLYSEDPEPDPNTQDEDFLNDLELTSEYPTELVDIGKFPDITKEFPYHDSELPGELTELPTREELAPQPQGRGR